MKVRAFIYYFTRKVVDDVGRSVFGFGYSIPKTTKDIKDAYVELPTFEMIDENRIESSLDKLFEKYNLQETNPLIKIQSWVKENKTHTSMSVGDIVKIEDDYYYCDREGWRKLYLSW